MSRSKRLPQQHLSVPLWQLHDEWTLRTWWENKNRHVNTPMLWHVFIVSLTSVCRLSASVPRHTSFQFVAIWWTNEEPVLKDISANSSQHLCSGKSSRHELVLLFLLIKSHLFCFSAQKCPQRPERLHTIRCCSASVSIFFFFCCTKLIKSKIYSSDFSLNPSDVEVCWQLSTTSLRTPVSLRSLSIRPFARL